MESLEPRRGSVSDFKGENVKTYKPNRKVVSAAVSGLVTLAAFMLFGANADPEIASSATLVIMTLIGYLVPLSDDTAE